MSSLLDQLNNQQQQAVIHKNGPAIVLAGAGSGKTKVLTTRVAWLINEKLATPEQILLVTFTNKAANEMKKRVMDLTGQQLSFSGTFHSLSAKILRREAPHIGLDHNFSIYDSNDQLSLIKQIYKEYSFDKKRYKPQVIKGKISQAKNEMLSPAEYEKLAADDVQEFTAKVYWHYQQKLKKQNAVDFDDLLLLTVRLLQKNKQILDKYQSLITHVLVDEYQDTNKAQYHLTNLLARPHNNIYVVGDFSQSIYAWRGADYRNLMNLKQDFPDISEFRLEQNYRSTQTILDAASKLISANSTHPILKLWTDKSEEDQQIEVIESSDERDEAQQIAEKIVLESIGNMYHDMAILYRTNAQSRAFEEAFVRQGIPYKIVGGTKFYERKEIKDLLAYLRIILNPNDTVSKERAEKIGKRRLTKLTTWLEKQEDNFSEKPPLKILENILKETQYLERFDKNDPQDLARLDNIKELLSVAGQFEESMMFMENVALVQNNEFHDLEITNGANSVTLMSLHSAKGLEFPIVFIVGLEEGLLPHSRSLWSKEDMEEERRLCYVGITRAKEKVYLSYALKRWTYGSSSYSTRSRFINEIPKEIIKQEIVQPKENSFSQDSYKSKYSKPKPKTQGRRLVVDEDSLEALLNDELDIESFLEK